MYGAVDASRDPAKAAKDVSRRVLVPYLPLFRACLERLQKAEREKASAEETVRDILGVIGHEHTFTYNTTSVNFFSPLQGNLYVGDEISISVRGLSPDQAKRIMKIISEGC